MSTFKGKTMTRSDQIAGALQVFFAEWCISDDLLVGFEMLKIHWGSNNKTKSKERGNYAFT